MFVKDLLYNNKTLLYINYVLHKLDKSKIAFKND